MKITKEQEARILALDPNFFSLELGKWYVGNFGSGNILFFFESLNESGNIKGYGFNKTEWYDNRLSCCHYGRLSEVKDWTLATPKQVEDRLEKEARIRYSTGDLVSDLSSDKTEKNLNMESAVMQHYISSDDMYFNALLMYRKGAWAEIIEEDKYYKTKFCLYKVSSKGFCVQVTTDEDYLSISKCDASFPFTIGVKITDVGTKEEFNSAYNSVNNKLINLKND